MPGSTQVPAQRLSSFAYGTLTRFGWLSHTIPLDSRLPLYRPYNPSQVNLTGLGYSHFARHYFGNSLFSSGYLDVSVPQVPFYRL